MPIADGSATAVSIGRRHVVAGTGAGVVGVAVSRKPLAFANHLFRLAAAAAAAMPELAVAVLGRVMIQKPVAVVAFLLRVAAAAAAARREIALVFGETVLRFAGGQMAARLGGETRRRRRLETATGLSHLERRNGRSAAAFHRRRL